jgi:hypothetical protein
VADKEIIISDPVIINLVKNIREPTLFYDNKCVVCYNLAKLIHRLFRGRIRVVGEFSDETSWLRNIVSFEEFIKLPWFYDPDKKILYGGRSMISVLLKYLLISFFRGSEKIDFRDPRPETCSALHPCTYLSGLLYIMKNSEKIKLVMK